jgi:hypothetical protein
MFSRQSRVLTSTSPSDAPAQVNITDFLGPVIYAFALLKDTLIGWCLCF